MEPNTQLSRLDRTRRALVLAHDLVNFLATQANDFLATQTSDESIALEALQIAASCFDMNRPSMKVPFPLPSIRLDSDNDGVATQSVA